MKTTLKLLFCLSLPAVLCGCSAQRTAVRGTESEILHAQAVQALENGSFMIRVSEFYLQGEKSTLLATDSYMALRDGQCEIKFSPDLSRNHEQVMSIDNLIAPAEITETKSKKNGDREYFMKIKANQYWRQSRILILLYKNSDECYVQMRNEYNTKIIRFKGHVCPLDN